MKKFTCLLALLLLLTACSSAPAAKGGVTFTDDLENELRISEPKTVAALSGSLADIWQLAGGTVACVTDDAATQPNLQLPAGVLSAGSLKTPSAEILLSAGVDFVLLSANIEGQVTLAQTLRDAGIAAALFDVETFEDYLRTLKICTEITGRQDLYETNGAAIEKKIDTILASVPKGDAPTALLLRAYGGGAKAKNSENNMTGAMLKELGCVNPADSDKTLLEDLSLEKIIAVDPDFIFVTTMGNSEEALGALAEQLLNNPAWGKLSAVREGHYVVLPKDLFHYKPNARWGESYETLAQILYPN